MSLPTRDAGLCHDRQWFVEREFVGGVRAFVSHSGSVHLVFGGYFLVDCAMVEPSHGTVEFADWIYERGWLFVRCVFFGESHGQGVVVDFLAHSCVHTV